MPIGAPGGRKHGHSNRAKALAYRHSPAGMQARKFYLMDPEVQMKMALRRKAKRHMKGLA